MANLIMNDVFKFISITIVYALTSSYGLYLIKLSMPNINVPLMLGIFFYGIGFVIWLWILKTYPLSIAFPVAAGTLILATQVFGLMLGEGASMVKISGVVLVISGVVLLSVNSQ